MTTLGDYAAGLSQPTLAGGHGEGGDGYGQHYDEVIGPDGALRPAWKGLAELAVRLTDDDLGRVEAEIVRLLSDDGVTYSRPGGSVEPWHLDPVPHLMDAASWTPLEVGLAQRAELLNAVLADLYGERRLLLDGVVPAATVLGHPGYVRVVGRASARDARPLVLTGTDLGRDARGAWRVLADRAQAPSGLGFAMENRRVLSRVLPELYRQAGLHRVEPFIAALRTALLQAAPEDLPDPRVVVLSPGSQSETAFDQAFLAGALGFPLVQGSDLVVREGWVLLRAFGRLERVDVILRRVDAAWSDPLELRGESRLGVAGLTEAVRRGRVRLVNGLGAGVLENPALLPYLPAACEALLGEPLRLPQADTWWCGDPDGVEQVLDRIGDDDLRLSTVDRTPVAPPGRGAGRAALIEQVLAAPHRFVGQRVPPFSQAPVWRPGTGRPALGPSVGATAPGLLTLRTFTVFYGSAYRPMAGGLGSIVDPDSRQSTGSKDVWVLKADPALPDQGLDDVLPLVNVRASTGLVPRILEDLFWTGRYAERAEDLLRLVIVAHGLAEDFRYRPRSSGGASLAVLLRGLTRLVGEVVDRPLDLAEDPATPEGPDGTPSAFDISVHTDLDAGFRQVLLDADRAGSVAHSITRLREALAGVRDQLSGDIWRVFGATDRAASALSASPYSAQVSESAGRMLTGVLALQGVTNSMMRDAGWHMIAVGRHLERALQLVHLLAATATVRRGLDVDRAVLNAVLTTAESAVTHRRRYRGYVRVASTLELLLTDETNPRSLRFAVDQVADHLAELPASTGSTRPERLIGDLCEQVAGVDVARLVAIGGEGRPHLDVFLDDALVSLTRIGEAIAELHLASGPAPRPLLSMPMVSSL